MADEARVTSYSISVLAPSGTPKIRINRLAGEVIGDASATVGFARVARIAGEVVANAPGNPGGAVVTSLSADVIGGANDGLFCRVTSLDAEVLGNVPKDPVRVSSLRAEVMADQVSDLDPIAPADLPTIVDFFIQHWRSGVRMDSSWPTQIGKSSTSLSEARRGSKGSKPFRDIQVRYRGLRQEMANRLMMMLRRLGDGKLLFPLSQHARLTNGESSGDSIAVDTTLSRFYNNMRVVIADIGQSAEALAFDFPQVKEKREDSLFLSDTLSQTYPPGSLVMPMILCEPNLKGSLSYYNDAVNELVVTVSEEYGPTALPPVESGNPDGFPLYQDFPILTIPHNWEGGATRTMVRQGSKKKHGRSPHVNLQGPRAVMGERLKFTGRTPQESWDAIRFLESREGRLLPFWVIPSASDWNVTAATELSINVEPFGDFQNLDDYLDYIGFVLKDGTYVVRE